uniref:Uncharacterized protein n=1 Tax=Mucochytrium quahogii TaxID=96639 RepID=A0A7S2SN84_9STRA|mmetsp:Transcript_14810/g.24107  ORF Transcript_14810/g.24107 Transcript_14810/m.24107 type:complete len:351 (+) Transcript_14810:247-1299(+)
MGETKMDTVHGDFVRMFKEAGLTDLATRLGIMKDDKIAELAENDAALSGVKRKNYGKKGLVSEQVLKKTREAAPDRDAAEIEALASLLVSKGMPVQLEVESAEISKSVRDCSIDVLRIVEKKGKTSYNEVVEELASEYHAKPGMKNEFSFRRKVHDILCVLTGMGMIDKRKQEYLWRGLPVNAERDLDLLQRERSSLLRNIKDKSEQLQELLMQSVALKNLVEKNMARQQPVPDDEKIQLPFIVVNTGKDTIIECEMAENQTDIFFNFNQPFEIHDDNEVLKRLQMQNTTPDIIKSYLPEQLIPFLPKSLTMPNPGATDKKTDKLKQEKPTQQQEEQKENAEESDPVKKE